MLILGIFLTYIAKLCIQNLTQGPQKIFGGSHMARGPHFGHPWYIALVMGSSQFLAMIKSPQIIFITSILLKMHLKLNTTIFFLIHFYWSFTLCYNIFIQYDYKNTRPICSISSFNSWKALEVHFWVIVL